MEKTTDNSNILDLRLAGAVQKALLTRDIPQCNCGKMVVENRMCEHIGGDFYHFQTLGQDQVAFALGDVVGHSTGAAMLMSLILGQLRTERPDSRRPTKVVQSINEFLIRLGEQVDSHLTCSFIYGVVDLPSGILLYVNAGHPYPIIYHRAKSSFELLQINTILLGIEDRPLEEACYQFKQHDRLVLFTDGITEAKNAEEKFFGERRLVNIISENGPQSPEKLAKQIFGELDIFSDSVDQEDDQTLVVIDFDNVADSF